MIKVRPGASHVVRATRMFQNDRAAVSSFDVRVSGGGDDQFRTKDGTYVDCLTDDLAVEAEYDYNWKEAIGQSLHYAESTNRKAGILFIKRSKSKKDYLSEMARVIDKYKLPIEIFIITEES